MLQVEVHDQMEGRSTVVVVVSSHPLQLFPFLILQNDPQNILCTELLELCMIITYFYLL